MNYCTKNAFITTTVLAFAAPFSMNAFAVDGPVLKDALVSTALPAKNFGADAELIVDNANASYIKIDLSTLPPGTTSSQISHASMLLWVTQVKAGGTVEVSPVTSAWDEYTVTANSVPASGAPTTTVQVTPGNANQFIVIDLTSLVKIWVDYPNQNQGVVLRPSALQPGVAVHFDSKEAASSHGGILDISLQATGPTGPVGPKGEKGDKGDVGPKGETGKTGATGATGPQGIPGVKGDKGDIGPAGAIGATGPQGLPGVKGDKGDTGPKGDKGDTGVTGAIGPQGLPGVKGDKGDTGASGAPGLPGPKGDKGDKGADGSSNAWLLTGNSGIDDSGHFIGTTDSKALNFKVLGRTSGRIDPTRDSTFFGYGANIGDVSIISQGLPAVGGNTGFGAGVLALAGNPQYAGSQSNVAVGRGAMAFFGNGTRNTAIGYNSLLGSANDPGQIYPTPSLGSDNTTIGYQTLYHNHNGSNNTALGSMALFGNVEGSNNVAIGVNAMAFSPPDVKNSIAIGANAQVTDSNMIRFGDNNIKVISGQVQITAASDFRLKEDIQPLDSGSNFIMKLHPVSYRMKNPADTRRNWGFIAQDVESLLGTDNAILTVGGDTERTLGLRYTDFIAPMVKTLQEQQDVINNLERQNRELRTQVESEDSQIKSQMANLKAELGNLLKKMSEIVKPKRTSNP